MIKKQELIELYVEKKFSMAEIADILDVSYHKVSYWMKKHGIRRRSISSAVYARLNPEGDPFKKKNFDLDEKSFLKGLGLGFYWGEGTKADMHSIRIANSDPDFLVLFIRFLKHIYGVEKRKLRFSLHLFNDVDSEKAIDYWVTQLGIDKKQFYKTQIVKIRGKGTYKNKSKYGVLTIYFNNKKLRDIIMDEIKKLKSSRS